MTLLVSLAYFYILVSLHSYTSHASHIYKNYTFTLYMYHLAWEFENHLSLLSLHFISFSRSNPVTVGNHFLIFLFSHKRYWHKLSKVYWVWQVVTVGSINHNVGALKEMELGEWEPWRGRTGGSLFPLEMSKSLQRFLLTLTYLVIHIAITVFNHIIIIISKYFGWAVD